MTARAEFFVQITTNSGYCGRTYYNAANARNGAFLLLQSVQNIKHNKTG